MIFQDELGSGGTAYKSWHRMVEGNALGAEVVNNTFATVPTHLIRFSNHRKDVREREARGNCVVPSLKTLILSSSFEIFLKMSPNIQAHLGGSRAARLVEIRIWEILE